MSKKTSQGISTPEERRLPVVPPRRVQADDLKITVGGTDYFPRKGQWVEYVRGLPWGYFMAQRKLSQVPVNDKTKEADPMALADAWRGVVESLSECIWDWNWTDLDGTPLPRPYRNVDAFSTLIGEETAWLNAHLTPDANPQS